MSNNRCSYRDSLLSSVNTAKLCIFALSAKFFSNFF